MTRILIYGKKNGSFTRWAIHTIRRHAIAKGKRSSKRGRGNHGNKEQRRHSSVAETRRIINSLARESKSGIQELSKEELKKRSIEGAAIGRAVEKQVEEMLQVLVAEGHLHSAMYHLPYSEFDCMGIDFTVSRIVDGIEVSKYFGITISRDSWQEHSEKRPDIPQFLVPKSGPTEMFLQGVLKLFKSTQPVPP